ncbi:Transposase [Novipirellula artificiosorum]|uniref:Transposase n=1 Tax=Novipirellula artificiosorum TaxID=2528016 RepID=A0A5C6D9X8_9BACT|nr:Transposase [Novipirellula artificiosorum]
MKNRKRHSPEQIVKKLRDADALLAAGKSVGEVLQTLEVSEATLSRWRSQFGGMKSEEAKRLKMLEDENNRLKKIVGDQALDIRMLKEITKGNRQALSRDVIPCRRSSGSSPSRSVARARFSISRDRASDM